jgi:Kelch motif
MDRMARDTKQPEVLQELFEALGNDPAVITECLARPILAERLIADLSSQGQTGHVGSQETEAPRAMSLATTSGQVVYTLPEIADVADPPCTDDTWTATTTANAPFRRGYHTAVWTGSEMIVWGGEDSNVFNTGGRYNPSTDSWTATSITNAPAGRAYHTAVWTGNEMIVWGGGGAGGLLVNGGRYNPSTNTWRATGTTNAPSRRMFHTAVWTGSEMIVWGGWDGNTNVSSGGRYNPGTDTWESMNWAPEARSGHKAVWTGNEMIVWGGTVCTPVCSASNSGGRYNSSTDSWTATSTTNAPTGRYEHTAVWTGSEMIVWGGFNSRNPRYPRRTGGRYTPSTNTWRVTSTNNAPTGRYEHTAVWTGSEMIVWGGYNGDNTGGRYCVQPPPNDDFADAIVISTTSGSLVGTNKGSTTEVGEPAGENSVWYRWTAPNNGEAHFRIGMDWLTIDVYTGTAINALTRIATSSGTPSAVNWTAVAGTTYRIRLTKNTRTAAFALVWSL